MSINDFLRKVGDCLGLDPLTRNEEGVCSLLFDDQFHLYLEPDAEEENLYLYAVLERLGGDSFRQEVIMRTLLEANCFGRGTGGACFSIDGSSDEIILAKGWKIEELSEVDISSELTGFLRLVEHWTAEFSTLSGETLSIETEEEGAGGSIADGRVHLRA